MPARVVGFFAVAVAVAVALGLPSAALAVPVSAAVVTSGAPVADNFAATSLTPKPEPADLTVTASTLGVPTALYPPVILPDGLVVRTALCTTRACAMSGTYVPAALVATTLAGRVVWRHSFSAFASQGAFALDGPWWEGGTVTFAVGALGGPLQLVALDPGTGAVVERTPTDAGDIQGVDGGYVEATLPAQDGVLTVRYVTAGGTALWSRPSYRMPSVVASSSKLLLLMTSPSIAPKAATAEWAIDPLDGRVLWQVTGATVPYGALSGGYLATESTAEPPPGERALDDVVVWSLTTRRVAWQRQATDWDTVFSGQSNNLNVVADGADLYGCMSPWAIGRPAGAAYCAAYALASGRQVRLIALPTLPRQVVVQPLAVSRRYLLVAVQEGPWSCKDATPTEKPLVACTGGRSLTMAVPLSGGAPIVAPGAALPYAHTYPLAGRRYVTLVSGSRAWLW